MQSSQAQEGLPEIDFIDDKAGKPVGMHQAIGRRPTIAFGNSDGDFETLEWTTSAKAPRLGVIVHHTDAGHEWRTTAIPISGNSCAVWMKPRSAAE